MDETMILLQVALMAEAKPLIEHFHLKKKERKGFPIWENEDLCLVISGIGKRNAAMATCYISGIKDPSAFLNIGICGHSHLEVGEGFLAHQIWEEKWKHHPTFSFSWKGQTDRLFCVDNIELEYAEKGGYDMESSAFFEAASRFVSTEQIHCYKVVSDHPHSSTKLVTKEKVYELLKAHVDTIETVIEKMKKLETNKRERWTEIEPEPFYQKAHFTQTQKNQFEDLLKRSSTLGIEVKVQGNASEMIEQLEREICEY